MKKLSCFAILTICGVLLNPGCSTTEEPSPVDCNTTDLTIALDSQSNPTSCATTDGTISVKASGGKAPYQFKLNSGSYASSASFNNLGSGTFSVFVKDSNECERELSGITITAPAAPVANAPNLVHQTNCATPNGSITVNVTGGTTPYQYQLGSGPLVSSGVFNNLKSGAYTITIKDASNCSISVNATLNSATGVSYANDIFPILQANCIKSGCHNGDNGANRNWSIFTNVKNSAQAIKTRTGNKSMPADIAPIGLPQNQIDLIACWVDDGALNN